MSKKPNQKLIGLFFVVSFLAFFAIIGYSLQTKIYPKHGGSIVMYFDESIQGLNIGAPVIFKGVEVGRVYKIGLEADVENLSFLVPVYVRMLKNSNHNFLLTSEKKSLLNDMIKNGLRARLASQSFLTGQLIIELILDPTSEIRLYSTEKGLSEIPTTLSKIGALSEDLKKINFEKTFTKLDNVLSLFERELPSILPKITSVLNQTESILSENKNILHANLSQFYKTARAIEESAKSVRIFVDYVQLYPEVFVQGKKDSEGEKK